MKVLQNFSKGRQRKKQNNEDLQVKMPSMTEELFLHQQQTKIVSMHEGISSLTYYTYSD